MQIKLIIWDLDDTLWAGTLADGDKVCLNAYRAEMVRKLNQCGVVSAICSKNDPEAAKTMLVELELFNDFVFPRISFEPKAAIVKQMIEDMQLRPVNVLFVDDNIHNLEEARYLLPELNVVNSSQPACDELLAKILEDNKHVAKSRVEEYRMLERRVADRQRQPISNEDFLRSCDIHVAVVHMTDNIQFSDRIEELINRSNQMNYTKSRVEKGSIVDLMATGGANYGFSVFVWDKYGYHGLVGFAVSEHGIRMSHFVFSCRIMDMGIENWLLHYIVEFYRKKSGNIDVSHISVVPRNVDWIREKSFRDPDVRAMIWKKEKEKSETDIALRVMSKCASGGLAHYTGLCNRVDHDGMGRVFSVSSFLNDDYQKQGFPSMLVYAAYSDYDENAWEAINAAHRFEECVVKFCDFICATNKKILIILTPQDLPPEKQSAIRRAGQARMTYCNDLWRKMAGIYDEISLLEVTDIAEKDEVIDNYHYAVPLLKKLGERIRLWFDREESQHASQPILRLI